MEFIAKSPKSQKLLNTLRVSANLPVNILIWGEEGTGKRTAVENIFKEALPMSVEEAENSLPDGKKEIFIYDLHRSTDPKRLLEKFKESRIIATSTIYRELYEELFPVILYIPPLRERPEDLEAIKELYIDQVKRDFDIEELSGEIPIDLSKNALSLKKSILTYAVLSTINEEEMMQLLERILSERLEEGYKNLLYLFEVPLLRAAKKRYRSNLAISKALQLNRATVTNKINRYRELIE
ncbi:MAG: hypothetical protein GXO19_04380 [Epsilonproteobacteria bacterium]|nr:hypothetical protein [Campylobacterota bacterium]NPA56959.1 hypothetical protein [Campylobacterota bacterium]